MQLYFLTDLNKVSQCMFLLGWIQLESPQCFKESIERNKDICGRKNVTKKLGFVGVISTNLVKLAMIYFLACIPRACSNVRGPCLGAKETIVLMWKYNLPSKTKFGLLSLDPMAYLPLPPQPLFSCRRLRYNTGSIFYKR